MLLYFDNDKYFSKKYYDELLCADNKYPRPK